MRQLCPSPFTVRYRQPPMVTATNAAPPHRRLNGHANANVGPRQGPLTKKRPPRRTSLSEDEGSADGLMEDLLGGRRVITTKRPKVAPTFKPPQLRDPDQRGSHHRPSPPRNPPPRLPPPPRDPPSRPRSPPADRRRERPREYEDPFPDRRQRARQPVAGGQANRGGGAPGRRYAGSYY
jgi:hypothetical protein